MAIKFFTERDLNILFDLLRYRTLTTNQINNLYFEGKEKRDYLYRKMYLLKKEGLLESRPLIGERGRKKTACYVITNRGIGVLEEEGKIKGQRLSAKDNRVEGSQLYYIVETNELYAQLRLYGWEMQDSREIKRRYQMNRSNLIQGALVNPDKMVLGFYILQSNPDEETVIKIIKEIENARIQQFIIFCKAKEGYDKVQRKLNRKKGIIGPIIYVIPYEFGINILKQFVTEQDYVNLYNKYGSITSVNHKNLFARYIVHHQGEEKYVANYLLGDQNMLYFLKLYGPDRYQSENRKVLLFAWGGQIEEMEKEFKQYSHIQVIEPKI
jgi:hypothetical protein